MILAASGVGPEINGKEPSVIPFHYAAMASLLQSIRKFTGRKTPVSRQPASLFFSVTSSVKQTSYASETTTLTVFSDFAVDFPSVFVTTTLYSEIPASAVLGL